MFAPKPRRLTGRTALAVLVLLPWMSHSGLAAGLGAAADNRRCEALVRRYSALAPAMRRTNDHIARLLDARRFPQAMSALRLAVSRYPDAWAGYTLGNLYAAGLGVPRDAGSAFRWYLWSARRGNRYAQRRVANAYLNGEGIPRNPTQAAYWFRIGVAPWQLAVMNYGLSRTYARGHLAPVNPGKSRYYLRRSVAQLRELARDPNGEAFYYLGLDYEYGHGVGRNSAKALGYLCRAAALQYPAAFHAIRHLQQRGK